MTSHQAASGFAEPPTSSTLTSTHLAGWLCSDQGSMSVTLGWLATAADGVSLGPMLAPALTNKAITI